MAKRITVAICTWNRAHLLRQTLEQMTCLEVPRDTEWELIVVNNNCSDDTDAVVANFQDRLPLVALSEPTPGKSHAANLAVREARGEYIVWTDDDVLLDREWLKSYLDAFVRWPDVAFFGGPIAAWFDPPPAAWLTAVLPRVGDAFGVREFDSHEEVITTTFVPFGANMAFRTNVLRTTRFDPRLGRLGAGMLGAEETALIRHLLAQGETGRWVPGAAVRHYIPPERQTIRHLRRYYSGSGATAMALATKEERQSRMLFGRPRWAWRAAIQNEIAYRVRRLTSRPEIWIEDLKRASAAWGILRHPASTD